MKSIIEWFDLMPTNNLTAFIRKEIEFSGFAGILCNSMEEAGDFICERIL